MDIVYTNDVEYSDYLEHHGIQGQKWGVRRFQNPDGTLTEAGQKRYNKQVSQVERRYDTTRKPTLFRSSPNYVRMNQVTYQARKANNKVSKLEERGADLERVQKAKLKAKTKNANLEMEKALQRAMKRMEMENVEDGSYADKKMANVGREAVRRIGAYAMAYSMAAFTGVGVGLARGDRRDGTSLTKDQMVEATLEAKRAFEKAMND